MEITTALPTFVITLREGTEATLVVGIVMACLAKANRSHLNRWVYLGIVAGLAGSVLVGLLLGVVLQWVEQLDTAWVPVIKQTLELSLGMIAIAMLSWMLVWMTRQARSLKGEIEGALTATLEQGTAAKWGVFTLILVAVLREGFETVIFIFASLQQGLPAVLGAIAGLAGATLIGIALFQWGVKINLKLFFQSVGMLLLLIVAGLVISALRHLDADVMAIAELQQLPLCLTTQSCILGPLLWDGSQVLPDKQFPGVVLKAFLGYRDHLYLGQILGYSLFLAGMGTLYFQSLQSKPAK
ncbi:MAG: FTR1 family protein [Cyanobacteria bacterium P01_G01_bin.54]